MHQLEGKNEYVFCPNGETYWHVQTFQIQKNLFTFNIQQVVNFPFSQMINWKERSLGL